jgi:hypothetical protein
MYLPAACATACIVSSHLAIVITLAVAVNIGRQLCLADDAGVIAPTAGFATWDFVVAGVWDQDHHHTVI